MNTQFKAKPWKTGNSHVVTIPSEKLDDGSVNTEKIYDVTLHEASQ